MLRHRQAKLSINVKLQAQLQAIWMTIDISDQYIRAPLTPRYIWCLFCDDIIILDTHTNTYKTYTISHNGSRSPDLLHLVEGPGH